MLIDQTAQGLGGADAAKIQGFFRTLQAEFIKLHPEDGPKRLAAYQGITKTLMARVKRMPASVQQQVYAYIDRQVIKPTGESLDPHEVDATISRLRGAVSHLARFLGMEDLLAKADIPLMSRMKAKSAGGVPTGAEAPAPPVAVEGAPPEDAAPASPAASPSPLLQKLKTLGALPPQP